MRFLLTVLVVVLAATSAWLWHLLEQERSDRPRVEVAQSQTSYAREVATPASVEPAPASIPEQDDLDHVDMEHLSRGFIVSGHDPRLLQDQNYMEAQRKHLQAALADQYGDLARVLKIRRRLRTD